MRIRLGRRSAILCCLVRGVVVEAERLALPHPFAKDGWPARHRYAKALAGGGGFVLPRFRKFLPAPLCQREEFVVVAGLEELRIVLRWIERGDFVSPTDRNSF